MIFVRPRHTLIPENYEHRSYVRRLASGAWQELKFAVNHQRLSPKNKFLIFAQGRSGSTLLTSTLDRHPDIRCDDEILCVPRAFPIRFLETAARQQLAKAYGFHVKIYQLHAWQRIHQIGNFLKKMEDHGWLIIYLWRENLLLQTVSNIFAEAAGTYHMDGRQSRPAAIELPLDRLAQEIGIRQRLLTAELEALQGISYLELNYERDLQVPDRQVTTFATIQNFIGVEKCTLQPRLQKMVIRPLPELLTNYNEVADWIKKNSSYADFIAS